MAKAIEMPSEEKAALLLKTVEDRLAEDPLLLDLRGKTVLADYFLICTGTSNVHIRAISNHVLEAADEHRLKAPKIEGEQVGEWVLMDFGDVVLHIMNQEARERFRLEKFWTSPQPHGALPPTPDSVAEGEEGDLEDEEGDEDFEFDEEDLDDAAFFDDADQELEPLDEEEELDDLDEEGDLEKVPATGESATRSTSNHPGTRNASRN